MGECFEYDTVTALMKLYLHIGAGKCGSTAIQACLFQNRQLLSKKGVYVPEKAISYSKSNHGLCFGDRERFLELVDELRVAKMTHTSAVVSWEGLFKMEDDVLKGDFAELREFDLEIIFYVREQAEHIQKGLLQRIKMEPRAFKVLKMFRKNRDFFKYAEKWSDYSGKPANVILFDRRNFPNKDVVEDFLIRIGVDDYTDLKWGHISANESLYIDSVKIMEISASQMESRDARRNDMLDAVLAAQNFVKGRSYFLTESQVAEIRGNYLESNMHLKDKYGVDLSASYSECWGPEGVLDEVNEELLTKFNEIQSVPLLRPHGNPEKMLPYLISGWNEIRDTWSSRQESAIRFRLKLQRRSQLIESITIRLSGIYPEKSGASTRLKLRGREMGNHNLDESEIRIPISWISDDGIVFLELHHQRIGASASDSDYFTLGRIDVRINCVDGSTHSYLDEEK